MEGRLRGPAGVVLLDETLCVCPGEGGGGFLAGDVRICGFPPYRVALLKSEKRLRFSESSLLCQGMSRQRAREGDDVGGVLRYVFST